MKGLFLTIVISTLWYYGHCATKPITFSYEPWDTLKADTLTNNVMKKKSDVRKIVNEFSWAVFHGSKLPDDYSNLVLSPVMVQLLLSVLGKASAGETKLQLQKVVGEFRTEELLNLLRSGVGKSKAQLEVATGMFVESGQSLNRSFIGQARRINVDIEPVEFKQDVATKALINKWASDATHGEVTKLLSDTYDIKNLEMILASAIYFHSTWKYRFNATGQQMFHSINNKHEALNKSVEFMELEANLVWDSISIGDKIHGKFVEIPYDNDAYSMIILLPDEGINLHSLIEALTVDELEKIWMAVSTDRPSFLTLKMPKFSISSRFSVVNALLKLGLVDLFTLNSQLPYIGLNSNPMVSDILQHAVLRVDENGTTASAATASLLIPLSADSIVDQVISVDRPFLTMILDKTSGVPLFISKVYHP